MPTIEHKIARSILSKASGFASGFDYTLNPYSGCAFACNYCYAAFFAPTVDQQAAWGQWVQVKDNALTLLQAKRRRPLIGKTIYMSSVTDPYQPVEKGLELTRALVRELLDYHDVTLVVQTRSPLVTRDLDLLRQFRRVRVHMTITTDDDAIRRDFEPLCPSIPQRLATITAVAAAGLDTAITMTPLLPVRDAAAFAERLLATGVQKFVIQHFHATRSRFAAGTGAAARERLRAYQWQTPDYHAVRDRLAARLPTLREGRDGFIPDW